MTRKHQKKVKKNSWPFSGAATHSSQTSLARWATVRCIQWGLLELFCLLSLGWRDEGKRKWQGHNKEFSNAERSLGSWQCCLQSPRSSRQLATPSQSTTGEATLGRSAINKSSIGLTAWFPRHQVQLIPSLPVSAKRKRYSKPAPEYTIPSCS